MSLTVEELVKFGVPLKKAEETTKSKEAGPFLNSLLEIVRTSYLSWHTICLFLCLMQ